MWRRATVQWTSAARSRRCYVHRGSKIKRSDTQRGTPMTKWTNEELNKIGTAEELEIASVRTDGTLRKPTTIWVVRVDDDLYVRSAYGKTSAWFRGTRAHQAGRIRAGGVERDVAFEDAASDLNDKIDAAYRTKYRQYAATYVKPMVSPEARSTTIKLVPR